MTHTYSITGMTCSGCAAKIEEELKGHPDVTNASVSHDNGEASITMRKHIAISELQALIATQGQYRITTREAVSIPMPFNERSAEEEKSWFVTYKPLLLIFLFITAISGIVSFENGQLSGMEWMNYFMAGFFIVFSFFKFLDLKGFADSYATYDLLAKKVRAYGFIYPFIELALGLAFLTGFEPTLTYSITLGVMGFSSIGVIISVLNQKNIRCACLGAVFNLPMSTVTIVEDLLMVAMAVVMLIM